MRLREVLGAKNGLGRCRGVSWERGLCPDKGKVLFKPGGKFVAKTFVQMPQKVNGAWV